MTCPALAKLVRVLEFLGKCTRPSARQVWKESVSLLQDFQDFFKLALSPKPSTLLNQRRKRKGYLRSPRTLRLRSGRGDAARGADAGAGVGFCLVLVFVEYFSYRWLW